MQEEKISTSAHFITLTYDSVHAPINKNGKLDLSKRDLQLFFKKLRKASECYQDKIKYFAVGEYGGKTQRPHYHILLFNCRVELIQPAWDFGSVYYGTVTGASIGYTLKYMSKKAKPVYGVEKPFALMSKGLGKAYVTLEMVKWHNAGRRMYCVLAGGKKISMSRYYKDKVFTPEMRKAVGELTRRDMVNEASRKPVISSADLAKNHIAAFQRMELQSTLNDKL